MRLPRSQYVRCAAEVVIRASQTKVWQALVHETSDWWPKAFLIGGPSAAMLIESKVGGRMYEDWGQDAGTLWFTVVTHAPPEKLELAGHLMPGKGGPGVAFLQITLEASDGGTRLSYFDSLVGGDDAVPNGSVAEGYQRIFGEALKAYVEG